MIINATDNQVRAMMAAAINASIPVGMGIYQHDPNFVAKPEDMDITNPYLDYVKGRMVKFAAHRKDNNQWQFNDRISADYQSWVNTYPSYQALFDAVKDN